MRYFFCACFLLARLAAAAQDKAVWVNDPMPPIELTAIVNAPQQAVSLAQLQDKVVIFEFWATWCGSCIASFPHLQKLQQDFEDQLAVFTVTTDEPARIEKFLKKSALTLPVVLDTAEVLGQYFPHRTIPHTVVLDKKGIVRAITTPEKITAKLLQAVLEDKPIQLEEKRDVLEFDPDTPLSERGNAIYQFTMTSYQEGLPSYSREFRDGIYKGRRILALNVGLRTLYELANDFPVYSRTILEVPDATLYDWTPETAYCVDLIVPPKDSAELKSKLLHLLESNFNLHSNLEVRQQDVLVLKVKDKNLLQPFLTTGKTPSFSFSGNGLELQNHPLAELASFLESMLNQPVLDETGMAERFDLSIPWYHENPKNIVAELEKIGLDLSPAERQLKMLILYESK